MAIYVGPAVAVDDNRRGIFQKCNPGVYTTTQANSLSKSEGDIIYNSTEKVLQVWDGSKWTGIGGSARISAVSGAKGTHWASGYLYIGWESSGSVTVEGYGEMEILLMAGGGGGGAGRWDGGGGAGGFVKQTVSVSPGTYTVTVGAAGIGYPSWSGWSAGDPSGNGTVGGNSSLFGVTAVGGGTNKSPKSGGCGAGSGSAGGTPSIGSGSQGFPGGLGSSQYPGNENQFTGGGGGGIGAAGASTSGPSTVRGNGGAGKSMASAAPGWSVPTSVISRSPSFGGGGGGGGGTFPGAPSASGADGGGGSGGSTGGSAIAGSGSGGGGGGFRNNTNYAGGNGATGFVVIRYRA